MADYKLSSVIESSTKTAPQGVIDQLGHALLRIIYMVAMAQQDRDIYFVKWDVNDGFCHLFCELGASETAQDVGQLYAQAPMGSLPEQKFEKYTQVTCHVRR